MGQLIFRGTGKRGGWADVLWDPRNITGLGNCSFQEPQDDCNSGTRALLKIEFNCGSYLRLTLESGQEERKGKHYTACGHCRAVTLGISKLRFPEKQCVYGCVCVCVGGVSVFTNKHSDNKG